MDSIKLVLFFVWEDQFILFKRIQKLLKPERMQQDLAFSFLALIKNKSDPPPSHDFDVIVNDTTFRSSSPSEFSSFVSSSRVSDTFRTIYGCTTMQKWQSFLGRKVLKW